MRIRREPPRFRRVTVRRSEPASARMVRVTLGGPELDGLTVADPASSVRLLLPSPGTDELVMPSWNGNEFLLSDGRRPAIRTFTPRRMNPEALELDLDIVMHDGGIASEWAENAAPGAPAAISGVGRGYTVSRDAPAYLLGGDESAIPAMTQLLEALPATIPVEVRIEVARFDARIALPERERVRIEWLDLPPGAPPGDALVAAARSAVLVPDTRVWVAGEAAAVQRIRRHLFEDRCLPRSQASVRGYWKHGRAGDTDED